MGTLRVLFVEDSDAEVERMARELRSAGYVVEWVRVETIEAMRSALTSAHFHLIVSDSSLVGMSAADALAIVEECGLDIPSIVVAETAGEEAVAEAMRAGALDFVVKSRMSRLVRVVERELRAGPSQSDEDVRQMQKLEAIGQLTGSVAHDFNNLLSIILSYTDLVIAELAPRDPLRGDLLEVQRAGQRAAGLAGQLLAFGRRQELQPQAVDLGDIVAGMEKMIRLLIGEGIELLVRRTPRLRAVSADPGQIEQVLLNLAVNARDAMPHGGQLMIESANIDLGASRVREGAQAAGPRVMLAVNDTGVGMDASTRERIFEPFFTTKKKGKGTGLGLSTVLAIVQQSGGTLSVESRLGLGTSFKIYFVPVEGAAAEPDLPIVLPEAVDPHGSETILLVEDDEPLRVLARGILHRYGYHVLEAHGAGDAILIGEQHGASIDLLLTDVIMPRITGRQLADRLMPLRPEMRVLYMSGYAHDEMRRCGILESGSPLLQKPITPESLGRKVRETLDQVSSRTEVEGSRNHHEAHPRASRR